MDLEESHQVHNNIMSMPPLKTWSCVWEYGSGTEAADAFDQNHAAGLAYAVLDVCKPEGQQKVTDAVARDEEAPPLGAVDVQLEASDHNNATVGRISTWLNLDSDNGAERSAHEKILRQELDYAEHLALPVVLLPAPRAQAVSYACFMNGQFQERTNAQYWLRIPLSATQVAENDFEADTAHGKHVIEEVDMWARWNEFRALCDYTVKLYVGLELTADPVSSAELRRWLGEPVQAVFIPTDLFLTDVNGYPILSMEHQHVVANLMKHEVQVVLSGDPRHEEGRKVYQEYMNFLCNKPCQVENPLPEYIQGYQDRIQDPMQPLANNLGSESYASFERDPVKYREYERAVHAALLDRVPEDAKDDVVSTIMVVGAGRGPLVAASLAAAEKAQRKVRVWAVEKNPNAIVVLQKRVAREWGDRVTLVAADMRDFHPTEQADILISELLGSFGDDELAPECLDGAQRVLKPDGISIPCASTSYVAPVSSSKLYNGVRAIRGATPWPKYLETVYGTHIHNGARIAEPAEMFTFVHPNKDKNINNNRYGVVDLVAEKAASLHGIAGYFDTTLYKDIKLSTHPHNITEDLTTWGNVFFPLIQPMAVKEGDHIKLHFWRKGDKHKVWYEWCVSKPYASVIHNPNARAHSIGL